VSVLKKLRDFVVLKNPMDSEYEYDELGRGDYASDLYPEEAQANPEKGDDRSMRQVHDSGSSGGIMSNVIGMPGVANTNEIVVMEPNSYAEMPQAIQVLRERKSLVLNLTTMDPDQAQRAVDFVAGGTYAMDGHQERVGESIFLFTPNCVQVTAPQPQSSSGPYEVPQPPARQASRPTAPAPAWAEPMRAVAY